MESRAHCSSEQDELMVRYYKGENMEIVWCKTYCTNMAASQMVGNSFGDRGLFGHAENLHPRQSTDCDR